MADIAMGTTGYMAPEQARDAATVDGRAGAESGGRAKGIRGGRIGGVSSERDEMKRPAPRVEGGNDPGPVGCQRGRSLADRYLGLLERLRHPGRARRIGSDLDNH